MSPDHFESAADDQGGRKSKGHPVKDLGSWLFPAQGKHGKTDEKTEESDAKVDQRKRRQAVIGDDGALDPLDSGFGFQKTCDAIPDLLPEQDKVDVLRPFDFHIIDLDQAMPVDVRGETRPLAEQDKSVEADEDDRKAENEIREKTQVFHDGLSMSDQGFTILGSFPWDPSYRKNPKNEKTNVPIRSLLTFLLHEKIPEPEKKGQMHDDDDPAPGIRHARESGGQQGHGAHEIVGEQAFDRALFEIQIIGFKREP
jgi:hypothetical protein